MAADIRLTNPFCLFRNFSAYHVVGNYYLNSLQRKKTENKERKNGRKNIHFQIKPFILHLNTNMLKEICISLLN